MITSTLLTNLPKNFICTLVACLALSATSLAQKPASAPVELTTVFMVDDQTGQELALKHGIQPLGMADIEVLINAVLQSPNPVRLFHQAVDEDASDNIVAKMDLMPYAGGRPPQAPSPGLPLSQLTEAMTTYRKARAEWQQGILAYRNYLVADIEKFLKGVFVTQMEVSNRFDRILAARNGRDFNRSDIVGSITTANRMLGTSGKRFLVCNTDAEDLPSLRAPRTTPLTLQELDPGIHIIFVNTSGLPDQSVLFRGLGNPVHHADSMRAAMEIIVGSLKPPTVQGP